MICLVVLFFKNIFILNYSLYSSELAKAHVAVVKTVRSFKIVPVHEYFILPSFKSLKKKFYLIRLKKKFLNNILDLFIF